MHIPVSQPPAPVRAANHMAEVIETSTTEFLAQCLDPDGLSFPTMPAFGSWVTAQDEETDNQIYGVVYHATTSPIDSVHRARALGLSLEELREQQPQIFAMLKTEFRVAIVGFRSPNLAGQPEGPIFQHLPPRPPQVHQAVYGCPRQAVIEFTEQLDFLRTILTLTQAPVDSLLAAVIRQCYQLRNLDRSWLVGASRHLSVLLKDDYDRLRSILGQVHA
ncbi:MAG TPA: hypothetical protein IGR64_10575 [Leptolyngbyaceae cyanobacterium M65_K2018_010]|nr:hypothetical protein [Leptolyngbyaceae cyanobacterium M65_K2018_010]